MALSLPTTPAGLEVESAFLAVGEQLQKKHRANPSRLGRRTGPQRDRLEAWMAAVRDATSSAELPGGTGHAICAARVQPASPKVTAKAVEAAEKAMAQLLVSNNLILSIADPTCWQPVVRWCGCLCSGIRYLHAKSPI